MVTLLSVYKMFLSALMSEFKLCNLGHSAVYISKHCFGCGCLEYEIENHEVRSLTVYPCTCCDLLQDLCRCLHHENTPI